MEVIKLNLIPTGALPVVHASQYDDGRIFRADLYDGAEVYHLDGTETISCELKKPDGNIVTLAVTNTSESFIDIQTTEQACAVAGESLAEVKIEKGDDKIGSLNFILSVERSPIEGGISSASEINNLWTQVDGMVADALATQYDSANVVFDNLPTEGHGIPYTVTSEGIGNAIDNALDMTAEASGAIATFESEYALPLRDLEIEINAVQESGTPTPSSPKAISGFTGATIYQNGANLWASGDVTFTGATKEVNISLNPNTYYISAIITTTDTDANICSLVVYYTDNTYISVTNLPRNTRFLFSFTATKTVAKIALYSSDNYAHGAGDTATWANIVLCDTAPTTTAITWQDDAGTVYGGSLDVTSGVLTVDRASDIINNLTTNYYSTSSINYLYGSIANKFSTAIGDTEHPLMFEMLEYGGCKYASQFTDLKCYQTTGLNIYLVDNSCSSKSDFITKYGTARLVWYLATPVTYQLTPTQISAIVGTNNVFTDTNGNTSLEYYTKRGEQTVRIAEGVAVDVINNKSIDTLATTDKTVKGAINELDARKAVIKTKTETLTANQFGTITPSITSNKILQIMATDATGNVIILPIYNSEYKVYSISGGGTISPFQGSIGVFYTYVE